MRSYFSAIVMLLGVLLWAGCNNSSTGSGGTGEKVTLQLNLKQGDVFKQLSRTTQNIEQKMMGMATTIKQMNEMYMLQEVLAVSAEGVADIRVTYERIKSETESAQLGKLTWDSAKDTTGDVPTFAVGFTGLVGNGFEYSIDKHGQVKDVRGVDSLYDKVFEQAGVGEMGDEVRASLKDMFGEDAMKSMMQSMSTQYPTTQVAVGDTWGGEMKLSGQFGMIVANTMKLENVEAAKVVVSTTGEIRTDKEAGMKIAGISIEYNMSGTSEGSMEIDRKSGMVSTSTIKQKINGEMKTMGMTVPMKIDQTVEILPY